MILIVCVDESYGMLFHQRRQSQDRVLRERIMQETAGKRLWMNAYSAKQFTAFADRITVAENCLCEAGEQEYCFVENLECAPYSQRIETMILYHWNRKYPADFYLHIAPEPPAWRLVQTEEFAGSSHEKITKEVYYHEKNL